MTLKEQIIQELEQSPDFLLEEFLNFILFTKSRRQPQIDKSLVDETEYLSQNPNNHQRLMESIQELASGKGIERELIE